MSVTSIRLDEKVRSDAERFAQKNGISLSEYLRAIIEKVIVTEKYHEQNPQPSATQTSEKLQKEKLQANYKKYLNYAILNTYFLLRLIVKNSGKFSDKTAAELINTAGSNATKLMKSHDDAEIHET